MEKTSTLTGENIFEQEFKNQRRCAPVTGGELHGIGWRAGSGSDVVNQLAKEFT